MFTSEGMELRDMGLWAGAQIAARVPQAREVNDGLRALFLPQHGRTLMVRLAQGMDPRMTALAAGLALAFVA